MAALFVMRFLPVRAHRAKFLYLGIAMIILSFACFAIVGLGAACCLAADTLMLGAAESSTSSGGALPRRALLRKFVRT